MSLLLFVYGVARYRREPQKSELLAFVGFMLAISLTQVGVIMGDAVTHPDRQLFWVNLVNGMTLLLVVYTLLWFALAYAGHDRWLNRWTLSLAVCHVAVSAVAVTVAPEFMYEVTGQSAKGPVTFGNVTFEQWVFLDRESKLPFVLFQVYSYAIVLASSLILARYIVKNRAQLYAGQVATLTVGIVTPVVLNSLVLVGAVSLAINYTTMSLGVTSIAFAGAIFHYRLFRLAPIGRQQVIDVMDDPIVMVDTEDRIVDCNRAARYLVASRHGWRGTSIEEFFSPFRASLTTTEDFSDRELSHAQNGTTQYFDPQITPITTQEAGFVGNIIVLREVTELQEQRQQIERQNEDLEQFTDMVSHDLRQPLTIAQGRLELAQEECDSGHLDDVADALERGQSLVEDLLMLAQTDDIVERTDEVSLRALAEECWDDVPSDGVTLTIDTDRTISADSTLLRQLLENLLKNAIEHGEPDTILVGETADGFYVADNGAGFPLEEHDKLFETDYSTDSDGTGLGLQIVQRISSAHGWEVRATDSTDGGAKIEITGTDVVE